MKGKILWEALPHLNGTDIIAYRAFGLDALAWLGGTLVVTMLASMQPALYAARLTVREVLAYE